MDGTDLKGFVEEQAKVGEDDPQLLPAVAVLELAQQVAAQLVLQRQQVVAAADGRVAVPAHVHRRVAALLLLRPLHLFADADAADARRRRRVVAQARLVQHFLRRACVFHGRSVKETVAKSLTCFNIV